MVQVDPTRPKGRNGRPSRMDGARPCAVGYGLIGTWARMVRSNPIQRVMAKCYARLVMVELGSYVSRKAA